MTRRSSWCSRSYLRYTEHSSDLQDYRLTEAPHSTAHITVSRYQHRTSVISAIIKALPPTAQIASHLSRFRYEYKLLYTVAPHAGSQVPTPLAFVEEAGTAALVMTNGGCTALPSLFAAGPIPQREALQVVHHVARALTALT